MPLKATVNKKPTRRSSRLKSSDYRHLASGLSPFTIPSPLNLHGARLRRISQRFPAQPSPLAALPFIPAQVHFFIGRGSQIRYRILGRLAPTGVALMRFMSGRGSHCVNTARSLNCCRGLASLRASPVIENANEGNRENNFSDHRWLKPVTVPVNCRRGGRRRQMHRTWRCSALATLG